MILSKKNPPSTLSLPSSNDTNLHEHSATETNSNANERGTTKKILYTDNELFQHGICRVPIPQDTLNCSFWANELSQFTPEMMLGDVEGDYAFYRNICDEPDFPFETLLGLLEQSEIGQAAVIPKDPTVDIAAPDSCLLHKSSIREELRLDDAFCVHYNMSQDDTSGAKHMDPSDITVNLCLDTSEDIQGSEVLFYGTKRIVSSSSSTSTSTSLNTAFEHHDSSINDTDRNQQQLLLVVPQKPGFATIHFGDHPHETLSLQKGHRTNVILTYCYTDPDRSQALSRTCYG